MKTIIDGKEIKLVTRNDISNIVSRKVSEMLGQGFNFYFYNGSQGEEGKICLTNDKGKTVYIFWIHKEYEKIYDNGWGRGDVMYITGKKYSDVYKNQTLWFSEGELFFEQKWFKLDSKEERYVENLEDWKILDDIHRDRQSLQYQMFNCNSIKLPEKINAVALKIINNRKGYKSITLKDIKNVVRINGFGYLFNFTENSHKESFSIKTSKSYNKS